MLLVSGAETPGRVRAAGIDAFAGLVDVADAGRDAPAAFALVRPDGVLAARGSRHDTHRAIDYLRQMTTETTPLTEHPNDPARAGA